MRRATRRSSSTQTMVPSASGKGNLRDIERDDHAELDRDGPRKVKSPLRRPRPEERIDVVSRREVAARAEPAATEGGGCVGIGQNQLDFTCGPAQTPGREGAAE